MQKTDEGIRVFRHLHRCTNCWTFRYLWPRRGHQATILPYGRKFDYRGPVPRCGHYQVDISNAMPILNENCSLEEDVCLKRPRNLTDPSLVSFDMIGHQDTREKRFDITSWSYTPRKLCLMPDKEANRNIPVLAVGPSCFQPRSCRIRCHGELDLGLNKPARRGE